MWGLVGRQGSRSPIFSTTFSAATSSGPPSSSTAASDPYATQACPRPYRALACLAHDPARLLLTPLMPSVAAEALTRHAVREQLARAAVTVDRNAVATAIRAVLDER